MVYQKITKAIVPAAGYGTRFLPQTKAMPKEMLPLIDKPVIQYVVEELVAAGIKKIIMITGWSKRAIEDHFDNNFEIEQRLKEGQKFDLYKQIKKISHMADIAFIRQREIKGTGHAIACAQSFINPDEPFLVHWGDSVIFSKIPVAKQLILAWRKYRLPILAAEYVKDKKKMTNYGMIVGKKINKQIYQVKNYVEKPTLEKVTSNLAQNTEFILTYDFFQEIKKVKPAKNGEIWHVGAVLNMAKKKGVLAYVYEGKRFDLGDKFEWLIANTELGLRRPDLAKQYHQYLQKRLKGKSPIPKNSI